MSNEEKTMEYIDKYLGELDQLTYQNQHDIRFPPSPPAIPTRELEQSTFTDRGIQTVDYGWYDYKTTQSKEIVEHYDYKTPYGVQSYPRTPKPDPRDEEIKRLKDENEMLRKALEDEYE